MVKNKYPELPDMERYSADESSLELAEKEMKRKQAQAARDRDAAIIGDIAKLGAQSAALAGGSWLIRKDEGATGAANERVRKVQESNAAQGIEIAKIRAAQREAKRQEQNKMLLEKYKRDVDIYKAERAQAKADNELAEKIRHNMAVEENARDREKRLKQNSMVSKTLESKKIVVNGKTYSQQEHGPQYLIRAWQEAGFPEVTRRVRKKDQWGYYVYDTDGYPEYIDEVVSNPDADEIVAVLLKKEVERTQGGGKNTQGLGWGKSNNNTDVEW